MINLFAKINLDSVSQFDHYLHGSVVREYEEKFADYVGARYAVAANSETSLIFVLFDKLKKDQNFDVPSLLPPVVVNALINGGNTISFNDDTKWVGSSYILDQGVLDSAQEIYQNQFKNLNYDVILYSNYPTKPIAGIDGGVLVSNDKYLVDYIRKMIYNGMDTNPNSWDRTQQYIGWKMYMSTIQAVVALNSLENIKIKKEKLVYVRKRYNDAFSLQNTSDHLYRVNVHRNDRILEYLKNIGINCGIHYKPLHTLSLFNSYRTDVGKKLPLSEYEGQTTLSIPFHEDLTDSEIDQVINEVSNYII